MFRTFCVALFLLSHLSLPVSGANPAFEVASIKVNTGEGEMNNRPAEEKIRFAPGSISMTNVTLITCLMDAYRLYRFQISGPLWMNSSRYDIAAKAADPVPPDQIRLMLRALLAERFHLTFHYTQRNLKVYSLNVGGHGHKLRVAEQPGDKAMLMTDGAIMFRNYSIPDLIDTLSNVPFRIDRPVLDMTGLEGRYDFEVRIAPDALAMKSAFEGMLKGDGNGPLLIDLIQEQLGLRFTAEQQSLDVLTVDGADRTPTAN
jgi:uncharacterized protein (TIGR03435 family)